MDEILAKASNQAVSFAIRSGISLASGFAIKKVSQLLDRIPPQESARLESTKAKLSTKTAILSTSIDLIKLSAARGNSALDSTVDLVSDLKEEIDQFETEIAEILSQLSSTNQKDSVKAAERKIQQLLDSINDAIPLINLALLTSGVNLGNAMDPRVSPSRLLQASSHIIESNAKFDSDPTKAPVKVGPTFDLKLYSIFYNPSRFKYVEEKDLAHTGEDRIQNQHSTSSVSWKEEFARASCRLERVNGRKYEYELVITEDFDDGRYHEKSDVAKEKRIKVHNIMKQFFSASGKLLRLEGSNSPVLTFKIHSLEGPQYVALGEVGIDFDKDSEDSESDGEYEDASELQNTAKFRFLSLLEYLIRLVALQESEQMSILDVKDEKLSLYLHDSVDNSLVPLSRKEKLEAAVDKESKGYMLQVDSSANRLQNLSLGGR